MFLKNVLEQFPIYTNIIKYINDQSIEKLCKVFPELKQIFDMYGYKRTVHIKYDDMNTYIDSLTEFEKHKKWIKQINGYDITNPFVFLPKCYNVTYSLYRCDNICIIPKYVKKLNIYTNKNIDIFKLGLVCPHVEEIYIEAGNVRSSQSKYTFKNLKKITIKGNKLCNNTIPNNVLFVNLN